MARDALIYLSFHEPWRIRLPIEPIPPQGNLETIRNCVFDLDATQYFFQRWLEDVCNPYTKMMQRLVAEGASFLVSVSGPLLQMLAVDTSGITTDFLNLLQHPNIFPVCSDFRNSISFYLDIDLFRQEMQRGRELATNVLGRVPELAVTPVTAVNTEIYHVCQELGFRGLVVDGSWDLLKGRTSDQLYRNGDGPILLTRNSDLSLRTAAILSQPDQSSYSIDTFHLSNKIIEYPARALFLGWHVGLFNGYRSCSDECATLERLLHDIVQRGIGLVSPDQILAQDSSKYLSLQLPAIPAVASEFGSIFYFLGHPAQQDIFCLMRQAFSIARLTQREELINLSISLAQWDVLDLLHQVAVSNGNGTQSHYFAPGAQNCLSVDEVLPRLHQFYEHFIQRLTDAYL